MKTAIAKQSKKKAPVPTSPRKRPNKTFIKQLAEFNGFMTCNQKVMLEGLSVKNVLQRMNNRAFDEAIKADKCFKIQKLMKNFVKEMDELLVIE